MAVITGTVMAIGGAAYSARQGRKAAKQQAASYDAATAEQARQFDVMQEAQQPYQQVGSAALNQLAALYGLPQYNVDSNANPMTFEEWSAAQEPIALRNGGNRLTDFLQAEMANAQRRQDYQQYVNTWQPPQTEGTGAVDFSNFFASPDYQFALKQGEQTVQNSAAAQGGLYSGNALRALTEYGQGSATQYLNNYANRLAGIAGVGQTAATSVGNAALQTGANIGNLMVGAGNARASGTINQANAITNLGNQLGMMYGMGMFGGGSPFGAGGGNSAAYNWSGPRFGGFA
jgi:hypothetical protein